MADALDLIVSGNVLTLSPARPRAAAVGVKNGRVAAVGDLADLRTVADSRTQQLDLTGRTLLPGFIDTHVHPVEVGAVARHVDLSRVGSVDAILAALAGQAAKIPAGQPLLAFNFNYDLVRERRLPTLAELDSISSTHPVAVIVYDVHSAQVNSKMLAALFPATDADGIVRDGAGNLTGLVEDPAITVLMRHIQPTGSTQIEAAVRAAVQQALQKGITTLHMKAPAAAQRVIAAMADELAVRIKPMVMIEPEDLSGFDALLDSDLARGGAVMATYADGAPDSQTAAFFEPYCTDPTNFGMLYYKDGQLEDLVTRAHRAGLQVSVHTCGTRATEQALTVYEKVLRRHPRPDHRHRIEHFEMPWGSQIRRAVRAGIALAMQPSFLYLSGAGTYENMRAILGADRILRWKPFRSILDAGGIVAGGSDAPVTPMGPLRGIQACVCHPNPHQRISRHEALQLFTTHAAWVGFDEDRSGTIEPGKSADFTVLAENPCAVDRNEIDKIAVVMTIIGGRIAFSA